MPNSRSAESTPISVDGDEANVSYDPITQRYSYVFSAEGEIEHTVVITDLAGNSAEQKFTSRIDRTKPSATLTSNLVTNPGANWTSQKSVTIRISAQDVLPVGVNEYSGLANRYVVFADAQSASNDDGRGWQTNPELTITFEKSGVYTVYPYVRDDVGNIYKMDPFTVNYVSDDLNVSIASPISSRSTEVQLSASEPP